MNPGKDPVPFATLQRRFSSPLYSCRFPGKGASLLQEKKKQTADGAELLLQYF